jgi:hypothetical protein
VPVLLACSLASFGLCYLVLRGSAQDRCTLESDPPGAALYSIRHDAAAEPAETRLGTTPVSLSVREWPAAAWSSGWMAS